MRSLALFMTKNKWVSKNRNQKLKTIIQTFRNNNNEKKSLTLKSAHIIICNKTTHTTRLIKIKPKKNRIRLQIFLINLLEFLSPIIFFY